MPIPNLSLIPGGVLHSTGQGVPVNGVNVFQLGIAADQVNTDWLRFFAIAKGPSVQSAEFVGYDPVTGNVTLTVVQVGTDEIRIDAWVAHSSIR